MQIVIEVPDEVYQEFRDGVHSLTNATIINNAVYDGKVLPKGHGRLIDEKEITKCDQVGLIIKDDKVIRCLITDAPTVIPADKEQK